MFYPEQRFIDLTREVQEYANLWNLLENGKVTMVPSTNQSQPDDALVASYMGNCRLLDLSNDRQASITAAELEKAWIELLGAIDGVSKQYDVKPVVPICLLLKTRSDNDDSQADRVFNIDCVEVLTGMGIAVLGTDSTRLAAESEHETMVSSLASAGIRCVLNLELRGVTPKIKGHLMVSPLNSTEHKRFVPARAIVIVR